MRTILDEVSDVVEEDTVKCILGVLLTFALFWGGMTPAQPPISAQRLPLIDMHVHAAPFDRFGNPPPPNPVTGMVPPHRTTKSLMEAVLREMKRYNIVKAVASGPLDEVKRWRKAAPSLIVGGLHTSFDYALPDVATVRKEFLAGRFAVLGELGLQYVGMSFDDPRMEPYYALAEELDIPVALHTGTGPSVRVPEAWRPLGNPASLEKILIGHPRMRLYLMHGAGGFVEDRIALMKKHSQVYADLARHNWTSPRETFHQRLKALMDAGLGKRLMFGSDQDVWPEAIGMAIEAIESATFLTAEQKRDIFYNNAARFLRLEDKSKTREVQLAGCAEDARQRKGRREAERFGTPTPTAWTAAASG